MLKINSKTYQSFLNNVKKRAFTILLVTSNKTYESETTILCKNRVEQYIEPVNSVNLTFNIRPVKKLIYSDQIHPSLKTSEKLHDTPIF